MSPLLQDLLDFADRLEAGALSDPVVDSAEERFAVRVERAAAVDLTILEHGPHVTRLHARGDAVATDRRLLLVADGEVRHAWAWRDVDALTLLRDGLGVACVPTPELHATGTQTLFGVVSERLLEHPPPVPGTLVVLGMSWLRVEGAWWASRGELDAWRERLRALPW